MTVQENSTIPAGMYHIIDCWYISIDEYSFTVYKRISSEGKKNFLAMSFHGKLEKALTDIQARSFRASAALRSGELADLVNIHTSATEALLNGLRQAFPAISVRKENEE